MLAESETVATLLGRGVPTLVSCGGGVSRSPAVAAGALALLHGGDPGEWLRRLAEHHPSDVSPGLWQEVAAAVGRSRAGSGPRG